MKALSLELKNMVKEVINLYGLVVLEKEGVETFSKIERLRKKMTSLRGKSQKHQQRVLLKEYELLDLMSKETKESVAKSFTLMLELMNSVENAFRSYRQKNKIIKTFKEKPEAIVYVLTAHPTEARHPLNLKRFQKIQKLLVRAFEGKSLNEVKSQLKYELIQSYEEPVVRTKKPQVLDEAEMVYGFIFQEEIFEEILKQKSINTQTYLRSWVGGDKDGHPGVDSKVFFNSLQLSRGYIIDFLIKKIKVIEKEEKLNLLSLIKKLKKFKAVKKGEFKDLITIKNEIKLLPRNPVCDQLKRILHLFPALVVPLEFRESSEEISQGGQVMEGMLRVLSAIAKGGDPRWYVRAMIVSMTQSKDHLNEAMALIKKAMGAIAIPVVPLFEQSQDLKNASQIMHSFLSQKQVLTLIKHKFDEHQEVMLGYSDSAKEGGALNSRLLISQQMTSLEEVFDKFKIKPIFFHGSGGSTDRGGGPISEQTKSWSKQALNYYKVTIQGEMIERSFFSPEVITSQGQKILQAMNDHKISNQKSFKALEKIANTSSLIYKNKLQDPEFLDLIGSATPYNYLQALKFGSRPTKRSKTLTVAGLRAIPWVLCWTQTRILFSFWWGVGSAWSELSKVEKLEFKRNYKNHAATVTYLKALDYTLQKIQLPIFYLYLKKLHPHQASKIMQSFIEEINLVKKFLEDIKLVNDRPWLRESIYIRSPLIHPLNMLQVQALESKNSALLRLTVAGIAFGMMATG